MQDKYFQKKHFQHSCLKSLWVLIVVTMVSPVLAQGKVASEPLSVKFGDFQAKAELTYPARGPRPFSHGCADSRFRAGRYERVHLII